MIQDALRRLSEKDDLCSGTIALFEDELNFPLQKITELPVPPDKLLRENYRPSLGAAIQTVFFPGVISDAAFDKVGGKILEKAIDDSKAEDYQGMAVFAVELTDHANGGPPTRTLLSELTRAFNRAFHNHPVVILFRYRASGRPMAAIAACERSAYRQVWREGEKPGRIALLRDMELQSPHAGHLRILNDLRIERKGRTAIRSFRDLYDHWRSVFDTDILSKAFYKELSGWFFWACRNVAFPGGPERNDFKSDSDYAAELYTFNAKSVIRLITRLLFTWFLKEKGLVARQLFDKSEVGKLMNANGDPSKYYKAILQNLFFATLNREMGQREFRSRGRGHYNVTTLYRYERLFHDPQRFLDLQTGTPFLNCSLFECQDKPHPTEKNARGNPLIVRRDGFSDREDSILKVPDFLFWSDESEVDLHEEYGEQKPKMCRVRGLIPMLHSYKFTIDENTPLEQEIALDPELLGKVFENLLAAYNPETQTTARKQTGSFYTPREIVDYMVTESLATYLSRVISTELHPSADALREKLEVLLDDGETQPFTSENGRQAIIDALGRVKILDPACGSGAFPMGALHRIVHTLRKLDPDNTWWRQVQIRMAREEIERALHVEDKAEREKRLKDISNSFEREAFDYTRKLFLIENCIFGVDLQPIAVQISMLRFFISLMVDQVPNAAEDNLGIKPLPNLETRFVAADTLIGIGPKQLRFKSEEIERLEKALAEIRSRHFNAKTWETKKKYRQKDSEFREKIGRELEKGGWDAATAKQVASWDPYDQNASAEFFDPEWMFGLPTGFDIVIGNPPYIRQEKLKARKDVLKEQYPRFTSTADIYVYFYDKGLELLKDGGVLCYITSNKYFRSNYGGKLRRHLAKQTTINRIIDFGDAPVFTSIAYPTIILVEKNPPEKAHRFKALTWEPGLQVNELKAAIQEKAFEMSQSDLSLEAWKFEKSDILDLFKKIQRGGIPLANYVNGKLYYGIKTGFNQAFVIDQKTRGHLIDEDPKSVEIFKPFLRGRDVKRWHIEFANKYLIKIESSENVKHPWSGLPQDKAEKVFSKAFPSIFRWMNQFREELMARYDQGQYFWELRACKYWSEFAKSKVVIPAIADRADYSSDFEGFFSNDKTTICVPANPDYLVALLNSNVCWWLIIRSAASRQGGFFELKPMYVSAIPIPATNEQLENKITESVQKLIKAMNSDGNAEANQFEAIIDAQVAHLYCLNRIEYEFILRETNPPEPFRIAAMNYFEDIQLGVLK